MRTNKRSDKVKVFDKRGVSPVIATILLIVLVLIIAVIIFFWFRQMLKEETIKFDKNIELTCGNVIFRASYSSAAQSLSITNDGEVPIYNMKIKTVDSSGDSETTDLSGFIEGGLNEGKGTDISIDLTNYDEVYLIPVLRGTSNSGEKTFVCDKYPIQVI
ncbi:MAG: archaellin/type IV pilin N-terminal domain-containing protein [Nanoarchaeota archaeon]